MCAIFSPSPVTAAMATAWRAFSTTPSSAPSHSRKTEPASTIPTTTRMRTRAIIPTSGPAARNLSADHGRLRHQLLLPRRQRRLREPLCSSRLTWQQHGANLSLTQRTEYPHGAHTELELKTDRDTTFALRLRIPAWAGPKSTLSINGKRVTADLTRGASPLSLVPGRAATASRLSLTFRSHCKRLIRSTPALWPCNTAPWLCLPSSHRRRLSLAPTC